MSVCLPVCVANTLPDQTKKHEDDIKTCHDKQIKAKSYSNSKIKGVFFAECSIWQYNLKSIIF